SRVTVQVNLGKALRNAAQQLLVPVNFQVGIESPLHQDARATQLYCLADLFVDGLEIEDVALFGPGALQRAVERTEGTVFGAEIGVVDIAVNNVGDHPLGMELAPQGIRLHANANQVI